MIMSHDSGTGYLKYKDIVSDWAKTQPFGFFEQLECGARSFDIRPLYHEEKLLMHHGEV